MNDEPHIRGMRPGDLETYVTSTLHAPLTLRPWPRAEQLPPYLRAAYRFFEGDLRGAAVLWLLAEDEDLTPKTVRKHLDATVRMWSDPVVFVFRRLPSYDRQRLIQQGVDFVVPGTQLYLPDFGIDFRSRAGQARRLHDAVLRPSAQMLLLHLLESGEDGPWTAAGLAPLLGYSKMTMARAVGQLEDAGLIEVERTGRANEFRLAETRREVWAAAQDRLQSPVTRRETLSVPWNRNAPLAGLSALARLTMLAEPAIPVRAAGPAEAKDLRAAEPEPTTCWQPATREANEQQIEVWSYDPRTLSGGPVVDRLSLYLSLRDDPDERVQQALEELLEGVAW